MILRSVLLPGSIPLISAKKWLEAKVSSHFSHFYTAPTHGSAAPVHSYIYWHRRFMKEGDHFVCHGKICRFFFGAALVLRTHHEGARSVLKGRLYTGK